MNTFSSLLLCLIFITTLSLGNSTGEYTKQDDQKMATTVTLPRGFDIVDSKGSNFKKERITDSADFKKSKDDIGNKKLLGRKMLVDRHDATKETMIVKDGSITLDGGSSALLISDAAKGTKNIASRNSGSQTSARNNKVNDQPMSESVTDLPSTNKISSQDSNANVASSSFLGTHDNPSENFESQNYHPAAQAAGKFMNMMHKDYHGSDGNPSSHHRPPINNDAPLDVDNNNELIHNSDSDFSTPTMMSNNQILDDYPSHVPKPRRKPPINNSLKH